MYKLADNIHDFLFKNKSIHFNVKASQHVVLLKTNVLNFLWFGEKKKLNCILKLLQVII